MTEVKEFSANTTSSPSGLDFDFSELEEIYNSQSSTEVAELEEMLQAPSYEDEASKSKLEQISDELGGRATSLYWNKFMKGKSERMIRRQKAREARIKRFASKPTDTLREKLYKGFRRNQEKAIGRAVVVGGLGVYAAVMAMRIKGLEAFYSYFDAYKHFDVKLTGNSTNYVFGGRLDPGGAYPSDVLHNGGVNRPVEYPATIAPIDAGPSLDEATDMGAANATGQIHNQLAGDPNSQITIEGFSEGSIAAAKTAMNFTDANGQLPSNIHLVLDGSPVSANGFFGSNASKTVAPFLQAAGITPNQVPLPAGTVVNSSQNDVWGNGANQSMLGNLMQAADMNGAHIIQDPNKPHVTWTDSNGVTYNTYDVGVHPLTQLIEGQIGGPVNSGWNDMFNAAIPINSNTPGSTLAAPSAQGAMDGFALGIDQATGNTGIPQQIIDAAPAPVQGVIQDGLNLANMGPDRIANVLQNPQDLNAVIGDVNSMINHIGEMIPSQTNHPISDFINNATQNVTGFNPNIPPILNFDQAPAAPATPVAPHVDIPAPASAPVHIDTPPAPAPAPAPNLDFLNNIFKPAPAPVPAPAPAPAPTPNLDFLNIFKAPAHNSSPSPALPVTDALTPPPSL